MKILMAKSWILIWTLAKNQWTELYIEFLKKFSYIVILFGTILWKFDKMPRNESKIQSIYINTKTLPL